MRKPSKVVRHWGQYTMKVVAAPYPLSSEPVKVGLNAYCGATTPDGCDVFRSWLNRPAGYTNSWLKAGLLVSNYEARGLNWKPRDP